MERDRRTYSDDDLREVSDNPEWTAEDFARAKPLAEALPDLAASIAKNGVRVVGSKGRVSVHLSAEIVKKYKAEGPGWEARIENDLRRLKKLG